MAAGVIPGVYPQVFSQINIIIYTEIYSSLYGHHTDHCIFGGGLSGFVPIFVQPSPSSSDRTTHIVWSIRPDPPDPPDLTSLCLILFMNSHMFSFHNTMSLRWPDPFLTLRIDLRPHQVVSLLLILSHGLSYASIILLYLVLSILLDYTSTSDLRP